jgi:general secretion pathway protein C
MKFRRPTVENRGWTWWLGCTFSLCLLLGAIAYWASIWLAPAVRIAPAGSLSDQSGPTNLTQAQGLFGQMVTAAPQAAVAAPSNIKVLGVLSAGQKGSAILTVDGKPAKVYMLGDTVEGQLKVISVDFRQVTLGQDGSKARQTLAAPPKSEISVLTQGLAKATSAGGAAPSPGGVQNPLPGSIPTPTSPITPPPSSILTPPPVIIPGSGGIAPGGIPPQPGNPNMGGNPGISMPSPNFPGPGGPNPGPQPTQ